MSNVATSGSKCWECGKEIAGSGGLCAQCWKKAEKEEDARHPKPTRKFPRYEFWFLWRPLGILILAPLHRIWRWANCTSLDEKGKWVYRIPLTKKVHDYSWGHGAKGPLVRHRFRLWLRHQLEWSYRCPCCGYDGYGDDLYIGGQARSTEMYEVVNGGSCYEGDYWWEGWKACWRCGSIEWASE